MKKAKFRLLIFFLIFLLFTAISSVWKMQIYELDHGKDDGAPVSEQIEHEEGESRQAVEGDPGLTDEEFLFSFPPEELRHSREEMVRLILRSIETMPFVENGRYWKTDFPKYKGVLDSRLPEAAAGVDSLGYVLWAYHAIFQDIIPDPEEAYRNGNRISREALRPGDIGMAACGESEPNHYGIFLGYNGGTPVFAHCSSFPSPGFKRGNARLCTLGSQNYYAGMPGVNFLYFTRPAVEWDEDIGGEDITALLLREYGADCLQDQYAQFGDYLLQQCLSGEYDNLYECFNRGAAKKGYQIEKESFIKFIETVRPVFTDREIRLYNIMELSDERAVAVRFCLAGRTVTDDGKEWTADIDHCIWQDYIVYLDEKDNITGVLPFNELGIEKE